MNPPEALTIAEEPNGLGLSCRSPLSPRHLSSSASGIDDMGILLRIQDLNFFDYLGMKPYQ
jgi:hypothetical protein